MKKNLLTTLLWSIVLFGPISAHSEPAKVETIKSLMASTGAGELGVQMMNQLLPSIQQIIPEAPETFWEDVMKEMDPNSIENMLIPIYQKYLTEEDMQAIIAFYDTPAGKKLISALPGIMQESMVVGQQWGENIATDILTKYKEISEVEIEL